MSSQITRADQEAPRVPTYQFRASREVLTQGSLLAIVLLIAGGSSHLSGKPLMDFACFGPALLVLTLFAHQYHKVPDSPLQIDVTARTIRSILTALIVAAAGEALLPEIRVESLLLVAGCVTAQGIHVRLYGDFTAVDQSHRQHRSPAMYGALKRVADLVCASIAVIVVAPLFLVIAVAIKVESSGPIFFTQERVGYQGRHFRIFKFRTMCTLAPRYERSPADAHDPRITRVGRVLRRFSFDELPQLFNVLRGEMSLVGPRPEMPFIVKQYSLRHRERLNAIPGVTGLWQISPARALPIHENLEYDLYYIAHRSFFLDLAILLRTAGAVIRGIGAV